MLNKKKIIQRTFSLLLTILILVSTFTGLPVVAQETNVPWVFQEENIFNEGESLSFSVNLSDGGDYRLELDYRVLYGTARLELSVDGEAVTEENIELFSVWQNEKETFEQDNQGNDLRPVQVRSDEYYHISLYDRSNGKNEILSLSLEAGTHVFGFAAVQGNFEIANVKLVPIKNTLSYSEYIAQYDGVTTNEFTR